MKFLKSARGQRSFQIDAQEKDVLFKLLGVYPMIPVAHHRLSKSEVRPDDQQLLEEAVASQRTQHRKKVERFLKAKSRFRANKNGFRFSLKPPEIEWLLQVLNDVRVGSWLVMGSPDGVQETLAALNEKTAPYLWAMETAGAFQMMFLRSVNGEGADDPAVGT